MQSQATIQLPNPPPAGAAIMNKIQILLGAVLISGALASSSSVLASTSIADYASQYKSVHSTAPAPSQVVNPTGLPRQYAGTTVNLLLTVDAAGAPRDIAVVAPNDPELTRGIVEAVAQWRFTPATRNGVPVATRVELPLRLSRPSTAGISLADPRGW